jgi:TRAP-type mannitol/chloroaromatic compound transport system permease small subunit
MLAYIQFSDRVSTFVGKLFAWTIVILMFVVCYEVYMRYVVGRPTAWAYDVSYMMYGAGFIMAGAYALSRNAHVRADVLYRLWAPKRQAGLDLVLYFIFFFPGVLAFIYSGYFFAEMSWRFNERSSFSPNGPILWPFKALLPVVGVLLLMQGIAEVLRCVICLRTGQWPPRPQDVEEIEQKVVEQAATGELDTERLVGSSPDDLTGTDVSNDKEQRP